MSAKQTPLTCPGHTRSIPQLQFGRMDEAGEFLLISACVDGTAMLRQGKTGDWIGSFVGHKGAVWSARLSHDNALALTGSADFKAKLWDATTGNEILTLEHNHIVRAVHFLPGSRQALTGGQGKILRIYDLEHPENPDSINVQSAIRSITSTDDGALIFTGGDDKEIKIWDRRTPGQPASSLKLNDTVTDLEVSTNKNILSAVTKKGLYFFDMNGFGCIKEMDRQQLLFDTETVTMHPTLPRFVSGGSDSIVHVYDSTTFKEIETYKHHHGPVFCVRHSPDGEIYASGSDDATIRLWQTTPGLKYGLWLGPATSDNVAEH